MNNGCVGIGVNAEGTSSNGGAVLDVLEMEEGFLFHFRTVRFLSQSLLVLLFYDLILLEKPWFLS